MKPSITNSLNARELVSDWIYENYPDYPIIKYSHACELADKYHNEVIKPFIILISDTLIPNIDPYRDSNEYKTKSIIEINKLLLCMDEDDMYYKLCILYLELIQDSDLQLGDSFRIIDNIGNVLLLIEYEETLYDKLRYDWESY